MREARNKSRLDLLKLIYGIINYWQYICSSLTVFRTSIAILLLLSFFVQTFQQAFTVFEFYVNQSYIASKLCENRFRPMLHCDGKCILAKKLQQEEKKDQQNPERKLENKVEVFSCSYIELDVSTYSTDHLHYFNYSETGLCDRSFPVFHPPCFV